MSLPTGWSVFLECRPQHLAKFLPLYKNNQSQVLRVHVGTEFDLNVLAEGLSLLKLSNLDELLNNGYVREELSSVFAVRNLRLRMIERNRRKDIDSPLHLLSVYFDVSTEKCGHAPVDAQGADAYRNLYG